MAVPKRRHSRSRTRKRRSANMKIRVPQYNRCPNCGEPVLSHRVCMNCGYYRGTIVIEVGKEV